MKTTFPESRRKRGTSKRSWTPLG